jgi:hypothetical protein
MERSSIKGWRHGGKMWVKNSSSQPRGEGGGLPHPLAEPLLLPSKDLPNAVTQYDALSLFSAGFVLFKKNFKNHQD